MIYTCTLNPSLDYYMFVEEMKSQELNRSYEETFKAGGKGVNVSIMLSNLLIPSTALGFLGGFIKDKYLDCLNQHRFLEPLFTNINNDTRINVKISGDKAIDINAKGPKINDGEWEKFLKRTSKIDEQDIFVFSGNVQATLEDKVMELLIDLFKRKVSIVLDTNPTLMRKLLKYHPLLIKPNFEEFKAMFDEEISDDDIYSKAKILLDEGAQHIIISKGAEGSIFISKDHQFKAVGIKSEVNNTTGAGDSMVAGYIFSIIRGGNQLEAFKYSVASSLATVNSQELASREMVEKYYNIVEMENL